MPAGLPSSVWAPPFPVNPQVLLSNRHACILKPARNAVPLAAPTFAYALTHALPAALPCTLTTAAASLSGDACCPAGAECCCGSSLVLMMLPARAALHADCNIRRSCS